jgi:hypothetical protein
VISVVAFFANTTLATRETIEWRVLDPHAAMPLVELLEQVGVHLEQIERRRIGQCRRFHEAEKQEKIVELGGLLTKLSLVTDEGGAPKDVGEAVS